MRAMGVRRAAAGAHTGGHLPGHAGHRGHASRAEDPRGWGTAGVVPALGPTGVSPSLGFAGESATAAARAVGGALIPVGIAWKEALDVDPELPLYGSDGYHPAPAGTLLAALTVYERLFGRDVRSIRPPPSRRYPAWRCHQPESTPWRPRLMRPASAYPRTLPRRCRRIPPRCRPAEGPASSAPGLRLFLSELRSGRHDSLARRGNRTTSGPFGGRGRPSLRSLAADHGVTVGWRWADIARATGTSACTTSAAGDEQRQEWRSEWDFICLPAEKSVGVHRTRTLPRPKLSPMQLHEAAHERGQVIRIGIELVVQGQRQVSRVSSETPSRIFTRCSRSFGGWPPGKATTARAKRLPAAAAPIA